MGNKWETTEETYGVIMGLRSYLRGKHASLIMSYLLYFDITKRFGFTRAGLGNGNALPHKKEQKPITVNPGFC